MEVKHIHIMPYIDQGELVVEMSVEGQEINPVCQTLEQIFEEYLDYRRNKHDSNLDPQYIEETLNLISSLRTIARNLEIETNELKGALH
jgi:hypothetical protein